MKLRNSRGVKTRAARPPFVDKTNTPVSALRRKKLRPTGGVKPKLKLQTPPKAPSGPVAASEPVGAAPKHVEASQQNLEQPAGLPKPQADKMVYFSNATKAESALKKALRRLQTRNYREESVNDSASDENNENADTDDTEQPKKRLPVYLQHNVFEEKPKKADPFEFVVESPRKKRNEGSLDSDCNLYDRSMHEILRTIEQNFAKKEKLMKKLKSSKKLNTSVEEIRRRVLLQNKATGGLMTKIPAPRSQVNGKLVGAVDPKDMQKPVNTAKRELTKETSNQNKLQLLTKEIQRVCKNISEVSRRSSVPVEEKVDERNRLFGFQNDFAQNKAPTVVPKVPEQNNKKLPVKTSTPDKPNAQAVDDDHCDDDADECDRFFGFDDDFDSDDSAVEAPSKEQDQDVMRPPLPLPPSVAPKRRILKELPIQSNTMQPQTNEESRYFGFDDDDKGGAEISVVLPSNSKIKTTTKEALNKIQPLARDSARFTLLTSTPLPKLQKSGTKKSKQKNKENINIISNIIISPPRKAQHKFVPPQTPISKPPPASNDSIKPSASPALTLQSPLNETMMNSLKDAQFSETAGLLSFIHKSVATPSKSVEEGFRGFAPQKTIPNLSPKRKSASQLSGPWRGDCLSVRRNPHFLNMKDTSLPSYNQDMILEPQLIEKSAVSQSRKVPEADKTLQTSILDFVNTSAAHLASTPSKNLHKSTFFDEGEFSPIKTRKKDVQTIKDKENKVVSSKLRSRKNVFAKGQPVASPEKPNEQNKQKFGLENYFGFDSLNDSKEQGKRITRSRAAAVCKGDKNENALPMRVPIKHLKKIRKKAAEELLDKAEPLDNVGEAEKSLEDQLDMESQSNDVPVVGLFEDLQDVRQQPERVYKRKRTKRVRLMSVDSDAAEDEKPKAKKKDVFTPAEEEEFNKWAAAFNAMCEEIEKHDLEKD